MVKMSANKKKALQTVFKYSKTTFLWGFIPFVVYLGNWLLVTLINIFEFFFYYLKS